VNLSEALSLQPGDVVAFLGAGGKTTAMFRAAAELAGRGFRVVTTTTTLIWPPTPSQSRVVVVASDEDELLARARRALARGMHVTVASDHTESGKLKGVPPSVIEDLARLADFVLVEADGARGRSLKAPADYEPVVPSQTTVAVPVVGIDAVGQPLTNEIAHRPEHVARVAGLALGGEITAATLARVLTSTDGGLKGIPSSARVVALVNKVETEAHFAPGREVARRCLESSRLEAVLLGAVGRESPVGERWGRVSAVVLAAGESRRFGRPKQLLPVGDTTLLEHVLRQVSSSWVSEVVVVLGYAAEQIRTALARSVSDEHRAWRVAVNERWAEGQSTSLRVGLGAISCKAQAALFVLGDQPHVSPVLINDLLIRYACTGAPIVMAQGGEHWRPPVLFDRIVFGDLREAAGDIGGREVVRRHLEEVEWVPIRPGARFADIDTPADYEAFLEGKVQEGREDSVS